MNDFEPKQMRLASKYLDEKILATKTIEKKKHHWLDKAYVLYSKVPRLFK